MTHLNRDQRRSVAKLITEELGKMNIEIADGATQEQITAAVLQALTNGKALANGNPIPDQNAAPKTAQEEIFNIFVEEIPADMPSADAEALKASIQETLEILKAEDKKESMKEKAADAGVKIHEAGKKAGGVLVKGACIALVAPVAVTAIVAEGIGYASGRSAFAFLKGVATGKRDSGYVKGN